MKNTIDDMTTTRTRIRRDDASSRLRGMLLHALLTGSLAVTALNATAATWYVSPGGNDSLSCASATTPCGTLNGVYQKAAGGDTVIVGQGSYGKQTLQAKTPASTIRFQPAAATKPTIAGVFINGAKNIEFRDMVFGEFQVYMNSDAITLRNVDVRGYLGYSGGNNITMIGGSVGPMVDYKAQIAPNAGWQGQGNNFVFDGVWFHDVTRTSSAVHIECLQVAGTTGMIIRNSRFTNCDVFDLSFTEYNNSGKVTNLTLENNFFDAAGSGGYFAVNLSQINGLTARFNSSAQGWLAQGTNSGTWLLVGNNVVSGILDGATGGCISYARYDYNVTQGRKCGATDLNAAPGFISTGTSNLRLAAGAAAIDLVPTSVGCPSTDIDAQARPAGLRCDAGAAEYGASSPLAAPQQLRLGSQ